MAVDRPCRDSQRRAIAVHRGRRTSVDGGAAIEGRRAAPVERTIALTVARASSGEIAGGRGVRRDLESPAAREQRVPVLAMDRVFDLHAVIANDDQTQGDSLLATLGVGEVSRQSRPRGPQSDVHGPCVATADCVDGDALRQVEWRRIMRPVFGECLSSESVCFVGLHLINRAHPEARCLRRDSEAVFDRDASGAPSEQPNHLEIRLPARPCRCRGDRAPRSMRSRRPAVTTSACRLAVIMIGRQPLSAIRTQ